MHSFLCQSAVCGTRPQTETLLHVSYGFFKNQFKVHIERLRTTSLLTLRSEIKVIFCVKLHFRITQMRR